MQETFLKAYRSVKDLRDPSALKSWIYRISVNECRKLHNRDRRDKVLEIPLEDVLPGADGEARNGKLADWSEVPLDRLLQGELKEKLDEAIQRLPDDFRIVLVLRDMEGFSTTQTAEILEIGEPLVKVRLHRARLAVRKGLAQYLSYRSA
jgi:RNA polymerase sigma-70 factor (ECF subfamily)